MSDIIPESIPERSDERYALTICNVKTRISLLYTKDALATAAAEGRMTFAATRSTQSVWVRSSHTDLLQTLNDPSSIMSK